MANYSKKEKETIDILAQLKMQEKLIDKLFDRVAVAEMKAQSADNTTQELLKIVAQLKQETEDVWENINTPTDTETPTNEAKTEDDNENKPTTEKGDLELILDA